MLADRTHRAKRNRCQQTQRTFDWQQDTIGVEESSFMFSIADSLPVSAIGKWGNFILKVFGACPLDAAVGSVKA